MRRSLLFSLPAAALLMLHLTALPAQARGRGSSNARVRLPSLPFLSHNRRQEKFPTGSGGADAKADPRLQQTVTVTADQAPLGDLGQSLTEKTGVRVEVAPEIADRRVFARVSGQPLGDLLVSLREMYGLHLVTLSGAPPAYRLERDPDTEKVRREKLDQERKALTEDLAEVVHWSAAAPAERYSVMLDELGEKAKERFVWHGRFKPDDAWIGLAAGALTPAELDQVLDGKSLRLPISRLSGAAREQLQAAWTQRPVLNDRTPSAEQVGRGWVIFHRGPLMLSPFTRDVLYVDAYVPLPDYPDHWGRMAADVPLPYRLYASQVAEDGVWQYPDSNKEAKEILERRLPADIRDVQVKKSRSRATLPALAAAFAPLYGDAALSVLADVTPQPATPVSRSQWAAKKIADALPLFCTATGRYVLQQGGILAFRSGRWFAFDAGAAPVGRVRDWERERAANGGRITARIAREAGGLTPAQRLDLARIAPWYAWEGDTLTLMRFYGALPTEAQARFLSSEGLPLAEAPREAQEALRAAGALLGRDTDALLRPDKAMSLAMEPEPGSLWFLSPEGRSLQGVPFVLKPAAQPLPLEVKVEVGKS